MNRLSNLFGIASAAAALTAVAPSVSAQENMDVFVCQYMGTPPLPEPLGDREGHAIRIAQVSCLATVGPLSGGVFTNYLIYEMDKANGVLLVGGGVVRKPGGTVVFRLGDGTLAPIVTDGKITGVTGAGRGAYVMAVGTSSALAGKSFTYSSKPAGPGQFEIDVTRD